MFFFFFILFCIPQLYFFFFFNDTATTEIYTLSLHDALPILKDGENSQAAKFYLSKDGKYLVRGEVSDLSKDPMAETRALVQTKDATLLGDPKAPVTLVEFSDFECPVCRSLHDVLRGMLPNYPQVRVVFKDFPLESL